MKRVPGVFSFERIGPDLKLLPMAARRALDAAGLKLSLAAWSALAIDRKRSLVDLGQGEHIDVMRVSELVAEAQPPPQPIDPADESQLDTKTASVDELLDDENRISEREWRELSRLERFSIRHAAKRGDRERLLEAVRELLPRRGRPNRRLTHLSPDGDARMVDVGDKPVTHRRAVAGARVRMRPETARMAVDGTGPKGDVIATARIAAIMAAKKTSELIPLCHPLALSRVDVDISVSAEAGEVTVVATVEARDRTGVEMEALTAAMIGALTIYDMLKAVQRDMSIGEVVLLEKSGGRSGDFRYEGQER
jgi:cyclic pyranopterin phosphate synthase